MKWFEKRTVGCTSESNPTGLLFCLAPTAGEKFTPMAIGEPRWAHEESLADAGLFEFLSAYLSEKFTPISEVIWEPRWAHEGV